MKLPLLIIIIIIIGNEVPLEGVVEFALVNGEYTAPLLIRSTFSRVVRRCFFELRFQFQNQTTRSTFVQTSPQLTPTRCEGNQTLAQFVALPIWSTYGSIYMHVIYMSTESFGIRVSDKTVCR